jgi:hypothetical protein
MSFARRKINRVRNKNAERDLNGAVVNPALPAIDDPGGQQTDANASQNQPHVRRPLGALGNWFLSNIAVAN